MGYTITLKQTELLPALKPEEVRNIIKFCHLNAGSLASMVEYDGCCWHDDIREAQSYVYAALELGYGLITLSEYRQDRGLDEEEEDDE